MTTKTLASADLEMEALSLADFLDDHVTRNEDIGPVIYVQDDGGRIFTKVSLVEETLSDESKVYNLILSNDEGDGNA